MKDSVLGPGAVNWLGVFYKVILSGAESGGAMSIVDSVSPAGSGPPRHIHHDADETFVVLTGECEFWLDGETMYRGPGETVFVPRGTNHTFRIVGSIPGRHLVILTPGGMEKFFLEMSKSGYRIPEDLDKVADVGQRYHLEFTGPPLGAGQSSQI